MPTMQRLQSSPTLFFVQLMLMFYLLFALTRLAFVLVYPQEFSDLSVLSMCYALLKGAWFFDSSIILVFLGIPFLLAYLPWRCCVSRLYLSLVSWYAFVVFCIFVVILIGDLLYFALVHRHAGHEVGAALSSSSLAMLEMIVSTYWLYLTLFLCAVVAGAMLWKKYLLPQYGVHYFHVLGWWRLPCMVAMFLLILLGMRGGIESKPIQPVFAYNEGSISLGHLTLNGVFSVVHGLEKSTMVTPDFMPMALAVARTQALYTSQHETFPDENYPLMRQRTSLLGDVGKPNVVILLLESWDSDFLDVTRELAGKTPYNITPNYNALVKKGRLYTNFYANGQRSIDGITALIAGIPSAPGAGYLGEGIESNNMGWLGKIAQQQGYQTSFLSGSYRASFYMDKIAPLAGFTTYYGSEDLRTNLHPHAPKSEWGGWDYDVMMTSHQLFEQYEQPFLSVAFSVSTHSPWTLPDKQWKKFAGNNKKEKFLNTIYYTDWVLGKFFEAVEQSSYAKNTIFILVGDHTSGHMVQPSLQEQHHLPLLMFGPNIEHGIDETLGSQVDLIPTIIDLAGWKSRYAGVGVSLLDKQAQRGVLFARDNMIGRIEDGAIIMHNLQRQVVFEGEPSLQEGIAQRLKAQTQVLLNVLQHNTLMSVDKGAFEP